MPDEASSLHKGFVVVVVVVSENCGSAIHLLNVFYANCKNFSSEVSRNKTNKTFLL